jgi:S1-C subfamily serine protease
MPVDYRNCSRKDEKTRFLALVAASSAHLMSYFVWDYGDGKALRADVIQTQTPIAPGNSGGPLLDDREKLVGINSFTSKIGELINYAVASDEVTAFLNERR